MSEKIEFLVMLPNSPEPIHLKCDKAILVVMEETPIPGEGRAEMHSELWQSHPGQPSHLLAAARLCAKALEQGPMTQFHLMGRMIRNSIDHGVEQLKQLVDGETN